jgi:hypothetical protein
MCLKLKTIVHFGDDYVDAICRQPWQLLDERLHLPVAADAQVRSSPDRVGFPPGF